MSNKKEKNEAYATDIEPSVLLEEMVKEVYAKEGVIPAIKRYRVETGAGLREAKDAVFAIIGHVSGGGMSFAQQFPIQFLKAAKVSTPSVLLEEMVKDIYAKEGLITAIQRYHAKTGVGLKEAKDIVFAITGHVSCRENGK